MLDRIGISAPRRWKPGATSLLIGPGITRAWLSPSACHPSIERGGARLWGLALLAASFALLALASLGFKGDPAKFGVILLSLPVTGLAVRQFRVRTGLQGVPHLLETVLVFAYVSLFATFLSFAGAALALPLRDAELTALDQAFGFDWRAAVAWVQERPRLRYVLRWSYGSIVWQPLAALCLLALVRQHRRAQEFIAAWLVAILACIALSTIVPAQSPYGHLRLATVGDTPMSAVVPRALVVFEGLRAGSLRELLAFDLEGIVTFPSFHALAGVLLAWAFWGVPWLRWPMLAINLAMIASTPVVGSHYLVDVVAGVAIAPLAVWTGRRMLAVA